MCITSWCGTARQIRGQLMQLREAEYVQAAQMIGASPVRVIVKHLLPNTISILILNLCSSIPGYIFTEASLSFLGMGHDLGVVANLAHRIIVMYSGKIMERGKSLDVFHHPRHPYTNALLEAVPRLDLENKQVLASIEGTPPDLLNPPSGCPFCTRCKYCMEVCCKEHPPVVTFEEGHEASCWLYYLEKPREDSK